MDLKTSYARSVAKIDDKSAADICKRLNHLLANEYGLFTKTLNYHWNITGPRFHSLHSFLETQYKDLLEIMDSVAERIRVLGDTPLSTVKDLNHQMSLKEQNGEDLSSSEMLNDLFSSNFLIQTFIKETVSSTELLRSDPGTEDFLISILQKHEMMSWMLKSHLE